MNTEWWKSLQPGDPAGAFGASLAFITAGDPGAAMRNNRIQTGTMWNTPLALLLVAMGGCGEDSTVAGPPREVPTYVLSYTEFVANVAPVLTKHGCDTAMCHAAPSATFHLSPREQKDHRFDFEHACKQVYPFDPIESPLLMKPLAAECGGSTHAGGSYFYSFDDPDYVAMLTWIENGEYR